MRVHALMPLEPPRSSGRIRQGVGLDSEISFIDPVDRVLIGRHESNQACKWRRAQRMAAERGMPELPWLSRRYSLYAKSRDRLCWPHLWPGRCSRGSRFWWLVPLELGVVTGVPIAALASSEPSHERCRSLGRARHGHRNRCRFPVVGLDSATEAQGRATQTSVFPAFPLCLKLSAGRNGSTSSRNSSTHWPGRFIGAFKQYLAFLQPHRNPHVGAGPVEASLKDGHLANELLRGHAKRGHGRHDADGAIIRWCFADPALAATFARDFRV